jgi:phosphoribosylaminoimidazolecarboxamide formyltransferase/IMP cyclohydrolase
MAQTKNALLSVFNKDGITEFAEALVKHGYTIYASGGTARHLSEAGIDVQDVAETIGGGAILDHRVVTISREIAGGLLADKEKHITELEELGFPFLDLVCCDLYPLEDAINDEKSSEADVVAKIDVGGPTMISSGAKGERIVVCSHEDRDRVVTWLNENKPEETSFLRELRAKAFWTIAKYRGLAAEYFSNGKYKGIFGELHTQLKYGENPQQKEAGFYVTDPNDPWGLHQFNKVDSEGGTGFVNLTDSGRLVNLYRDIKRGLRANVSLAGDAHVIALGGKHGNPCGGSIAATAKEAIEKMIMGDARALFGGSVLVDVYIDEELATVLLKTGTDRKNYFNVIIAKGFSDEAKEMLKMKKKACHLFELAALEQADEQLDYPEPKRIVQVPGGFLLQDPNMFVLDFSSDETEAHGDVTDQHKLDMLLGWAVMKNSNSNTICLVKDGQLIGNGVGQQDRVSAAELAIKKAVDAGHDITGAVAGSDSFFPFPDGPEALIAAGVVGIFSTSGSIRDGETVAVCEKNNVSIVFVSDRVGRSFAAHSC